MCQRDEPFMFSLKESEVMLELSGGCLEFNENACAAEERTLAPDVWRVTLHRLFAWHF